MTRALAVVAHYDDAVLWMGGAIKRTRHAGWDWTVVAMCVAEAARRQHFEDACVSLGADHTSTDFVDVQSGDPFDKNRRDGMRKALQGIILQSMYDWVFTHSLGKHCEYGYHANHMEVAQVVAELAGDKKICDGPARVAHFAYEPIYGGGIATVAVTCANAYLQLEYNELLWKCRWCERAARLDGSLRSLAWPCPNPEAFSGEGLSLPGPFVQST